MESIDSIVTAYKTATIIKLFFTYILPIIILILGLVINSNVIDIRKKLDKLLEKENNE